MFRPAACRLIPLLLTLLLTAAVRAAPVEIGQEAAVGEGVVRVDQLLLEDTLAGTPAAQGRRWLVLAGRYRRGESALPALLESASEAFRLRLADGLELVPDERTAELAEGWWGPRDVFPAEAWSFLLVFSVPEGALPQALLVRLEGAVAEIPLTPAEPAVAAAEGPPTGAAPAAEADTTPAAVAAAGADRPEPARATPPETEGAAGAGAATVATAETVAAPAAPPAGEPAAAGATEEAPARVATGVLAIPPDDEPPAVPPASAQSRNVLPLDGVVAAIEAVDGHEAVRDGRKGSDAPVARAPLGEPLTILLSRPIVAERILVVPRAPEGGGYRLRLEISPDGEAWELVDDTGEGWFAAPLRVALGGRPVKGIRITATAASEGIEALAVEEVELFSREHIPALRYDLAWAGFGGRVVAVDPPGDPDRSPFRLVDGDSASWWSGREGQQQVEIVLGFLDNRAFAVDALQLVVDPQEGIPTTVEIATSLEGPDRGFEPVGRFAVPLEREPLFVFQPRAARFVRLRLEGPRGADRLWLAGVRVFEAEGEGMASKFRRLAAVAAEAPEAKRIISDWRQGGDLLAYPPLEGGDHWGLHDGERRGVRTVAAGEAAFTFAFLGGERARVDEVRLYVDELGWPGRLRVEAAQSPEGPFTPVAAALLPPGEGWRRLSFAPVETRYLRVVITTDPERVETLSLGEIAVLERPRAGLPSIVEVPPQRQQPLGPNVALAVLGGRVVRVSAEEQHEGWSARRLIDGLVADLWTAARGSLGFTTPEEVEWPVEIDLELAGSRPVRLVGVGIDPQVKIYERGIFDTDFRGDPANRPRRFEVEVSLDGERWQPVLAGSLRPRWVRQTFPFARPVEARFVRFRFLEAYGGDRLQLGELEVYEDPVLDSTQTVLAERELNIARPELGGAVVAVSSQNSDGKAYVANLFDGNPRSIWSPGKGWRWPQKLTLAFAGDEVAEIAAVELVPREPQYRPRVVKIRTTTGTSPARDLELVGRFEAPPGETVWRIDFPQPVRARFLEISFVEGFDPRALGLGELRVIEVRRSGYSSVVARGLRAATSLQAAGVGGERPWQLEAALEEREPNDDPSQAQIIEPGPAVAGRIAPPGERDHFLLRVEAAEPRAFRFLLEGRPTLRARVEFEDKGGAVTELEPEAGRSRIEGTLQLAPGGTMLRLFEPRTRIVLVVDTSGSMELSVADVRAAVEGFLEGMTAQEEVALVAFASKVQVAQDFTTDRAQLIARAGEVIGAEGGTALYDAMKEAVRLLEDWQGNRAVVLLSDGADSASKAEAMEIYRLLAESGVRLYAVALGAGMQRFVETLGTTPARMLGYWARVSDGAMLATPSSADLERLYERIARDLRTGTRYRFRFTPEVGTGRLVVRQTGERIPGVGVPDRILFILDASGSMRGRDRQGRVKMATARQVLIDLVRSLPDDVMVGLRVYGHRYPRKPKARSCTDSQLVVPFQRVDREAFAAFVRDIRPRGQTPIGLSLAQVAEDFGNTPGRKVVVLITDGEETCAKTPDDPLYPPRVVAELQRRGVDLEVQIVGFDIAKSEVRRFLQDLAEQTGGRFYTAEDAAGLKRALDEALRARFVVRDLLGEPVAEGVLDGGAVELPTGRYSVEIASTRPLLIRDVRIEAGRETRLDVNREGEEIAVDRSITEPGTPLAAAAPEAPAAASTPGTPVTMAAPPDREPPGPGLSPPPLPGVTAPERPLAPPAPPAATSPSREQRIALLLEEAEQLLRQRKLTRPEGQSALARYRAVLALDPNNEEAKKGLARIARTYVEWADAAEQQGDLAKAERYYGRALKVYPEDFNLLVLRGITRLQLERFEAALEDLDRARELRPDDVELWFYAGLARFYLGRMAEAEELLERVWREGEGVLRVRAGHVMAAALVQLGRIEEAYQRLQDAIEAHGRCESRPLDDLCASMWTNMVRILRLLGRDDVVMDTLVGLLELEPQGPGLYDAIAETFRANGREAEARRIERLRRERFGG